MYRNELLISPNYSVYDYIDLNLKIGSDQIIWNKAIDIFKDRIEGRFLLLIQDLSARTRYDHKFFEYSFSSMALSCLLIETLFQFSKGLDETKRAFGWQGINKDAFIDFFKESDHFRNHISDIEAEIFYKDIRCGILHQAQTKRNSQLTIDQGQMIINIDNGIRVDVELFIDKLIREYESYVTKLKFARYGAWITLRENFIRKMNFITRL